jgi:hypothetical protein
LSGRHAYAAEALVVRNFNVSVGCGSLQRGPMMRVAFGDYSALGNKPGESSTIANIGDVYRVTSKYAEALVQYQQFSVRKVVDFKGNRCNSQVFNNLHLHLPFIR